MRGNLGIYPGRYNPQLGGSTAQESFRTLPASLFDFLLSTRFIPLVVFLRYSTTRLTGSEDTPAYVGSTQRAFIEQTGSHAFEITSRPKTSTARLRSIEFDDTLPISYNVINLTVKWAAQIILKSEIGMSRTARVSVG